MGADKKTKYADVIIDISHEALDRVFQYRVPFSLWDQVETGSCVTVPFGRGNRKRKGYVIAMKDLPDYDDGKIKDLCGIDETGLPVERQLIQVAAFLRRQYGGSMLSALRTVMPVRNKVRARTESSVKLSLAREEASTLLGLWEQKHCLARARLLRRLIEEGEVSKAAAVKECGLPLKEIRRFEEKGVWKITEKTAWRNPFPGLIKKEDRLPLNEDQERILNDYQERRKRGERGTHLLYGVTGSGKTEVYLALIEEVLADGQQAIVLIPEISLTYQTVRRFYERFGDKIAVIHSRMSKGERYDAAERIIRGEADLVIGARSALFAPVKNLGMIIIDEEHDGAYKSETTPKYHARETAIYRAGLAGADVVLGSATPLTESYAKALSGEYNLWTLPERAGDAGLARAEIIDLRKEFTQGNKSIFSGKLREKMEDRLQKKEKTLLFLNRRGYAGFVSCRSCGEVVRCPHCDVSLTYHRDGSLRCHYCGYEKTFSRICSSCGSPHVAAFGLGTEKVEAALRQEFPQARVLRMDTDTTRRKNAYREILEAFSRGEADILLGTQMIVKGHDFPDVTLVGVLAADLSLYSNDFRSGEKTFQLLCQAAGRAGRGESKGEVVIQTYSPEHYAIVTAANQSYERFFDNEYAFRKMMHYPPCAHMLMLLIQSEVEETAVLTASRVERMIRQSQETEADPVVLLSPGPARVGKIRDQYRQVLYMKHEDPERLIDLKGRLEPVLENHPLFGGIFFQFDFDPMSLN